METLSQLIHYITAGGMVRQNLKRRIVEVMIQVMKTSQEDFSVYWQQNYKLGVPADALDSETVAGLVFDLIRQGNFKSITHSIEDKFGIDFFNILKQSLEAEGVSIDGQLPLPDRKIVEPPYISPDNPLFSSKPIETVSDCEEFEMDLTVEHCQELINWRKYKVSYECQEFINKYYAKEVEEYRRLYHQLKDGGGDENDRTASKNRLESLEVKLAMLVTAKTEELKEKYYG